MGRAARDNPCLFADADRFFFGCESNPCRNRRELLTKYADYLDRVYPRRCCDNDPSVTHRIKPPSEDDAGEPLPAEATRHCHICRRLYQEDDSSSSNKGPVYWKGQAGQDHYLDDESCDPAQETIDRVPPKAKIGGQVMDRAFKPVLNVFYGMRGATSFRRKLEALARDLWIRNCGPGAALRMAMKKASLIASRIVLTGIARRLRINS